MRRGTEYGDKVSLGYAGSGDTEAIAVIHADSWRRHYRGAFQDAYLDADILTERVAVWHERLAERRTDCFTVVAKIQNSIVGFGHVILDDDPNWGSLLDNLHVTFQRKRKGIGSKLMQAVAERLMQRGRRKFYLWVLDQNLEAQQFYAAQGGSLIETCLRGPFPGGGFALSRTMLRRGLLKF